MNIPNFNFNLEEAENTVRFYQEIFTEKIYALENVVDVGANRGLFSYYIAPFAHHVYALEPHEESFHCLAENILHQSSINNIRSYQCALGKQPGMQTLLLDAHDGGHRLISQAGTTEVHTLASFMQKVGIDHIDLLKIDIEGGEPNVFLAEDIDMALAHVSIITGEGHGLEQYMDVLNRNHFVVFNRATSFIARREEAHE